MAACLLAPCARAEVPVSGAPGTHVIVDCVALDPEHRAALEARAKADLIVRHETGTLAFECSGATGVVAWTPASGRTLRGQRALPSDADGAIETLLEGAERLIVAGHEAHTAAAAPPTAASPEPTEAAPPPASVIAAPPPGEPAVEPRPPPPARPGLPFGFAAGAAVEIWDQVPAVGPGGLVSWYAVPRLRIDAGGSLLFSTEERLGVTGRLVRVRAGGEFSVDDAERFRVGAGLLFDTLKASADAALGVDAAQNTSFGGRLHFHYAAPVAGSWRIAFGPYLTGRAAPVRVELGTIEAFRVPVVTGGAEVQLEWDGR
jgi:hypothetical protein